MEEDEGCRPDPSRTNLAEILERLQQAPEGGWLRASRRPASRIADCAVLLKAEGVGESLCLADALRCHPEPGRREAPRRASNPVAATGPYDAIFSTTEQCEDQEAASD